MIDKYDVFLGLAICGLVTVSLCVVIQGGKIDVLTYNANSVGLNKADGFVAIACGSDSMGLQFGCGDKLIYREVLFHEELIDGDIYVFNSPYTQNSTTVHRLLAHTNDTALFKGDNNRIADPLVNRSDVLYKVIGVSYE